MTLEQSHFPRRLAKVLAGVRVRGIVDDVACLLGLGSPEDIGYALFGSDS
jgi:hypothetical protein